MAEFTRVADVQSIPCGSAAIFDVGARIIAVFNVGGEFYAIDNACSHRGGPVGEGSLHGTTVSCPWHGTQFDVTNGQVLGPPAMADITSHTTKVEEDGVWVEMP
jgi:3-phenylpropionate/trans-cinnamate dioxygenase ferredoxin subunit